jgi:hypothetical protein
VKRQMVRRNGWVEERDGRVLTMDEESKRSVQGQGRLLDVILTVSICYTICVSYFPSTE